MKMKYVGASLCVVCVMCVAQGSAMAATLTVPAQYATIQDAIDASVAGDRVEVSAGTYTGQVDFDGKDIELVGVAGAASTVIDGNSAIAQVVKIDSGESSNASIRGFTISGGFANSPGGDLAYAGLMIDSDVSISDCVITSHRASHTGFDKRIYAGMNILGGAPTITRVTVEGNNAENRGGFDHYVFAGVTVLSGTPRLSDVVIQNNTANASGGLYHFAFSGIGVNGGTPRFERVIVRDNITRGSGIDINSGSVGVRGGDASFDNLLLYGYNDVLVGVATRRGAVFVSGGVASFDHMTLTRSSFGNSDPSSRVVRATNMSLVTVANSIVRDNGALAAFDAFSSVSYTNAPGLTMGVGNIDAPALFADPANQDFSLRCGSPSIDAASSLFTRDVNGSVRPVDGDDDGVATNDQGALESPVFDADGDGVIDCQDNCPSVINPGQEDYDSDMVGDVCDSTHTPETSDVMRSTDEEVPFNGTLTGFDYDSDTLTYRVVSGPANGTLTSFDASTGAYTYEPGADFNGLDSFTFVANDGALDSNTSTVAITINPVNDAPVAADSMVSTDEDVALNDAVSASDVDSASLTYSVVSGPTNGTLTSFDASTGAYTYEPGADFNGLDSFTFVTNDGALDSNTSTVAITINPVNDAPVATDSMVSTDEDTALNGAVSGADIDSASLTYSVVSGPTNGTLTSFDASTGAYTYEPAADFNGLDSFTFVANDGALDSNTSTVAITINPVNDAPVAADSMVSTDEDTALNGAVSASDVDSASLTYSVVSGPTNGTLTSFDASTGAYTYEPAADFNGLDSFTFVANDGALDSNTSTVAITVNPVNDAPMAADSMEQTTQDMNLIGVLSASDVDGDTLTYSIESMTAQGQLVSFDAATGDFVYQPDAGFVGLDSFTFKVSDGQLDSNLATVSIEVTDINDLPVLEDLALSTDEDTPVTGQLVATDADGDALTYRVDMAASLGDASVDPVTGVVTYTPNANANGEDSFTVIVSDAEGDSNVATVTVSIAPVNDPPVFIDPTPADMTTLMVAVGDTLTFEVDGEDVDGDALTFGVMGQPVASLFMDRSFSWSPQREDVGGSTLTLDVSDGTESSTREVTIVVTDGDRDGDGLSDATETALGTDPDERDSDGDGISDDVEVGDDVDAPLNSDGDDLIDALDEDSDDDGLLDGEEAGDDDLDTPAIDTDADGLANYRDTDSDDDGVGDDVDNCLLVENADQLDINDDGVGDACEDDDDGDTILDADDNCPLIANTDQFDGDEDGIGDVCDEPAEEPTEDSAQVLEGDGCGCASSGSPAQPAWPLMAFAYLCGLVGWRKRKSRA